MLVYTKLNKILNKFKKSSKILKLLKIVHKKIKKILNIYFERHRIYRFLPLRYIAKRNITSIFYLSRTDRKKTKICKITV